MFEWFFGKKTAVVSSPDETMLKRWGLLRSCEHHNRELINMAIDVYKIACRLFDSRPQTADCQDLYSNLLYVPKVPPWLHPTFQDILKDTHIKQDMYETLAQSLARYVVEQNWKSLEAIPCP